MNAPCKKPIAVFIQWKQSYVCKVVVLLNKINLQMIFNSHFFHLHQKKMVETHFTSTQNYSIECVVLIGRYRRLFMIQLI